MYLIVKTIDLIDSLAALCCVLFSSVFCSVEGGELFDRIVSVGRFEEPTAKLLFYQMLVAVKVRCSIIIIMMIMIMITIEVLHGSHKNLYNNISYYYDYFSDSL